LHADHGPLECDCSATNLDSQLSHAFRDIANDTAVRVLILTGTGSTFCRDLATDRPCSTLSVRSWSRAMHARIEVMTTLLDIEVPVITAVNGPATVQSQVALLGDIVLASLPAEFSEPSVFHYGVVPGDSAHVVWPLLLGLNRAQYFLMTGQSISAADALALGLVNEIVCADRLLCRAWELAAELEARPREALRNIRVARTKSLQRSLQQGILAGLSQGEAD
jgi:enoyl-CoA hydratase/carnithine racemase